MPTRRISRFEASGPISLARLTATVTRSNSGSASIAIFLLPNASSERLSPGMAGQNASDRRQTDQPGNDHFLWCQQPHPGSGVLPFEPARVQQVSIRAGSSVDQATRQADARLQVLQIRSSNIVWYRDGPQSAQASVAARSRFQPVNRRTVRNLVAAFQAAAEIVRNNR